MNCRLLYAVGAIAGLSAMMTHVAPVHAKTGDVIQSFPSSFPSPDGLAWDGQYLWATDCSTSRIDKVDPDTGNVLGTIDVKGINSDELAWDGAALWLSDHTATEMPGTQAPAPALYRVDVTSARILRTLPAPGVSKFPMGVAWDGSTLWNVDAQDSAIIQIDSQSGKILRKIPTPVAGGCGLVHDGGCLWFSTAETDGLVYHLNPATGEILRSFAGPGGPGHQSTGVAWDGRNLWVHDEAFGRAAIYKLAIDDVTEGGRCSGAITAGQDAGVTMSAAASDAGPVPVPGPQDASRGCTLSPGRSTRAGFLGGLTLLLVVGALFRTRRTS